MTLSDRYRALNLAIQQTAYERLRGKGIGVVTITLVIVDGELSCWSDPKLQSFGPYNATRDLANCLAGIDISSEV